MKNRGLLTIVLLCALTVGLGCLSFFGIGPNHILGVGNINLGLDLRGGVTILYEADIDNPTSEDMNAANNLMRRRLDERNYTEATTGREGTRQIRVNIPGVEDPERAVAEIGATALLTFTDEEGNVLLTGADVARARTQMDTGPTGGGRIVVGLEFNAEGSRLFEQATRDNLGRPILIYMDDQLVSSPVVQSIISGGSAQIDGGIGGFSREEADNLANTINQGSLPFGLTVASMNSVGAQLGADALTTSVIAGIIGIILMIIALFVVYKISGFAANIALLSYTFLMLLVVSAFQITLTLPGIAGIILSVGMAIDANVIIFERIREEIATGRTLRSAVNSGFKRAFPAVVDCNITTLMAAAALFWQGTGPIQGFAITLGLGILVSMFSALVLTRILINALVSMGLRNPKWYGAPDPISEEDENQTAPFQLKVIEWRKYYLILSAVVLIAGVGSMLFNASQGRGFFNLDVEFSGGTSFQIDIGQPFNNTDLADIVYEVTGQTSPQIQSIGGEDHAMIRMHSIDADTRVALMEAISARYNLTTDAFTYADVSPTVSADMQRAAVWAVLIACLLMLVYITYRFKDIRMGASTVMTLLHDAFMTIAVFAILRIPLSYAFIAVLLTIMGYSINATIVIFDRLRENRNLVRVDNATLVNTSVSQTLRRSVLTSATTLLMVLSLFIVGVPAIRDFALPIMIGLFFGTYSSVFLSGSFWYMLSGGDNAPDPTPITSKISKKNKKGKFAASN
ncbi:MAG: protein translocase subunit SecD [Defluviitaleaceae bacterium]|nr:protein translocase subunit SecD [Defluviitaleaceae bacterium]